MTSVACGKAADSNPIGIVYASTYRHGVDSQARLEAAIDDVIRTTTDSTQTEILWTMGCTLDAAAGSIPWNYHPVNDAAKRVIVLPDRTHDLAFDDSILDNVKDAWETILGERSAEYDFLRFEERKDMNDDDD